MIELKPCPFCGGEARPVRVGSGRVAKCRECGAGTSFSAENPAEAWNRRAIDVAELLKIADDLDSGWEQFHDDAIACEDADRYEQEIAARIRKAVVG